MSTVLYFSLNLATLVFNLTWPADAAFEASRLETFNGLTFWIFTNGGVEINHGNAGKRR